MKKVFSFMFLTVAFAAVVVSCKSPVEPPQETATRNAVLLEYFSTQYCGYCPPAAAKVSGILTQMNAEQEGKLAWVVHHTGYYEDQFTIAESLPLLFFYQSSSEIYAPAAMIDRTIFSGNKVVASANAVTKAQLEKMLAEPTYVSLNLNTSYDATSKQIKVDVSGKLLKEYPNAMLTVYLVQDSIKAKQAGGGAGDQYVHRNVVRKVISAGGAWGDPLGVTKGEYSKSYTYTLPESITGDGSDENIAFATDAANTYIVAFVSEKNNIKTFAEAGNNKVHNTAIKKLQ